MCATPAAAGGETWLAGNKAVYRAIDPAVRQRFLERRGRYARTFHGESPLWGAVARGQKGGLGWSQAFATTDPRQVQPRGAQMGAGARWLPSGRLVLETVRPAAIQHPDTGELAWFNSAHLFRHSVRSLGPLKYALSRLTAPRAETRTQDAHFGDGTTVDAR